MPGERLTAVNVAQLRTLLEALTELAPKVEYPAVPEMRITAANHQYLVQVRDGGVRFSSWSARAGGCGLTPAQIVAAITGTEEPMAAPVRVMPATSGHEPVRRTGLVVLLGAVTLGCPLLTWMLTGSSSEAAALRRAGIVPEYRLLEAEPAKRQLERHAGAYETGQAEGDRRLVLRPDGTVVCAKYGPGRTLLEEITLTAVGAEAGGKAAFLTGNRALIEFESAVTLKYIGDKYSRVQP